MSSKLWVTVESDELKPLIRDDYDELESSAHPGKTLEDVINERRTKPPVYLKHFWKLLFLVAIFYGVPSIQFIALQYLARNIDEDSSVSVHCYYNLKCAHKFVGLEAFNNIVSNVPYILLGSIFLVYMRIQDRKSKYSLEPKGVHLDLSLYYALGWCLIFEGIFSSLYHVCPSKIAFQFDMTFMIVGSGLLFINLYSKRHPTVVSGPYRVFGFFAAITLLNSLSLLPFRYKIFWVIVILILIYVSLLGSYHLYYGQKLTIGLDTFKRAGYALMHPSLPSDKTRFIFIVIANIINFTLVIYMSIKGFSSGATQDFPSFVLGVMTFDIVIYLTYYVLMKFKHKEKILIRSWIMLVAVIVFGSSAIYFFNIATTNKFLSPEESNKLNKPCVLFGYFDDHDVWHFLSACGVACLFFLVYFLDMDLKNTPVNRIAVF